MNSELTLPEHNRLDSLASGTRLMHPERWTKASGDSDDTCDETLEVSSDSATQLNDFDMTTGLFYRGIRGRC
ncbi:Uncharacterized protein BM_BM9689 [Brugia malayi]|nr:Uncharacterized protein BM_BM9689 [Brugia malayi]VDO15803.1 unnamed protein product [Brugia timori]VIO94844.1 Uncharacterized protein BM_BM9689 [Brugia malayi]